MFRYPFARFMDETEPQNGSPERLPMTVCIATMAEKSRAIVMVSDKAVAYGNCDEQIVMPEEIKKT